MYIYIIIYYIYIYILYERAVLSRTRQSALCQKRCLGGYTLWIMREGVQKLAAVCAQFYGPFRHNFAWIIVDYVWIIVGFAWIVSSYGDIFFRIIQARFPFGRLRPS